MTPITKKQSAPGITEAPAMALGHQTDHNADYTPNSTALGRFEKGEEC